MNRINLSIIIPVYNESEAIAKVLIDLKEVLFSSGDINFEIIVVNDGSKDETREVLENVSQIKLINHPYNKGYGASLKTGIKNSQYEWVLLLDGDGQHNPYYIKEMIKYTDRYDMIVGDRTRDYKGPLIRRPAKVVLGWIANYLVEKKIPDLNCGFRLIKKRKLKWFWHLLPNSFSFTTTITLAFFKEGLNVKYIPVKTNKRRGKSSLMPQEAIRFFILILRTIFLFSPLRIFLPISLFLFGMFSISFINDVIFTLPRNITDLTLLLLISSLGIFSFGLLADQIAAIRREMRRIKDNEDFIS